MRKQTSGTIIAPATVGIETEDGSDFVAGDYLNALDKIACEFEDACEGFKSAQAPALLRLYADHAEAM